MNKILKPGQRILLHMTLTLDDGSVADSTRALGKPSLLQLGDSSLSNALEQQLLGLKEGDKKKFRLQAKDAFGVSNPQLIQFMEKQQFPQQIALKKEQIVSFTQPNGEVLPGIIRQVVEQLVTVDFNHPLAGEAITFDIEVLKIHPATRAESGQGIINTQMT